MHSVCLNLILMWELETSLLETSEDLVSPLIVNILVSLLQGCYRRCDISSDNYEPFLKDILHYRWHIEDRRHKLLDNTNSTFGTLSLHDRVQVLLAICHYRLTADDVEGLLQCTSGDALRLEPLGHDSSGSTYWYFYGTRLYKESRHRSHKVNVAETSDSKRTKNELVDRKYENTTTCSLSLASVGNTNGAKVKYPMLKRCNSQSKRLSLRVKNANVYVNSSQNTDQNSPDSNFKNATVEVFEIDSTADIPMTLRASSRHAQRVQGNILNKLSDANVPQPERSDTKIYVPSHINDCQRADSVRRRERESERIKKKTDQALNLDVQLSTGHVRGQRERSSNASVLSGRGGKMIGADAKVWQVICSSYNDWKLLTEKLSRTEKKCEADLVELLEQNFLKTIRELFLEKEKQSKKRVSVRLNEVNEKAPSNAITVAWQLRSKNVKQLEPMKHCQIEDEKKRLELEKARLQEERSQRHRTREEKISMLNESDCSTLLNHKPGKLLENKHVSKLFKILRLVKRHDAAWPFVEAVDERYAPCYYDIIKVPMYLVRIESKLRKGLYRSIQCIVDDFNLIVDNSCTYNGLGSEYTDLARLMLNHFNSLMKHHDMFQEDSMEIVTDLASIATIEKSPANREAMSSEQTLSMICSSDFKIKNSPDRTSTCSSSTVAYLSSDDNTMDMESPNQKLTSECDQLPFIPSSIFNSTEEDLKTAETNCKLLGFPSDLTVPAEISVSCSMASITITPASSSFDSNLATYIKNKSTTSCYPLPGKFRYRNDSISAAKTITNISTPTDGTSKSDYINTECARTIMPDLTASGSLTSTIGLIRQLPACSPNNQAKYTGDNSDERTSANSTKNDFSNLNATREGVPMIQDTSTRDVPRLQDIRTQDVNTNVRLTASVARSDVHDSNNGSFARVISTENATRQQVERLIQVSKPSFSNGFVNFVTCLSSNLSCTRDTSQYLMSYGASSVDPGKAKMQRTGESSSKIVEKNVQEQRFAVESNGDHKTVESSSFRQVELGVVIPSMYVSSSVPRNATMANCTSSRSDIKTKFLERIPSAIRRSAPQGIGLDTSRPGTSGSESQFGSNISSATLNSRLQSTFNGSAPNIVFSSSQGINAGPIGSLPRIDSMFGGLPLVSGILPNGVPWPPRLIGSVRPHGYNLLPSDASVHLAASNHVRSVAQTAFDYVSHLRPNCGLSPLVLHSPQSMSPQLPQPYSSLPKRTSPAPPTSRLSISIPPPSPSRGSKYQRQPLGDGILTTQPPGNLFLVTPSRAAVAGTREFTVGSLMGAAAFQWPQPPIVHYDMLRLPPGT